jgi:hypothetical protein
MLGCHEEKSDVGCQGCSCLPIATSATTLRTLGIHDVKNDAGWPGCSCLDWRRVDTGGRTFGPWTPAQEKGSG